jgi:hypothetical protein
MIAAAAVTATQKITSEIALLMLLFLQMRARDSLGIAMSFSESWCCCLGR